MMCHRLVLAVAGLTVRDPQIVRAAYLAMNLIAWYVIAPLMFAALLIGVIQSLGTRWGLIQHYWIVAKLVLTAAASMVSGSMRGLKTESLAHREA